MNNPEISVLLPFRDAEETLAEALESLLEQTFGDFEVLAVDDGSTDGSWAVLQDYAARDPRIVPIRTEAAGIVPALEEARSRARGSYVARMDADDRADPERFAKQRQALEDHPDWLGCGCHTQYFPPERVTDGAQRYEDWLASMRTPADVRRDRFVECPLAHPTLFLRREGLDRVGGYVDRGWPEDYDLVQRLLGIGELGVVPEVLLHWRDSGGRLSRQSTVYSDSAFRACKLHYLLETHPGRELVVWGAGPVGKSFARAAQDKGVSVRAFVDIDPRKVGQEIHGATVVPPSGIEEMKGALCVAAVGQDGARSDIREALRGMGWVEEVDFVAVA